MSTQYRLVQSGKTAGGGCSAGQGSSEPVAQRIYTVSKTFFDATELNYTVSNVLYIWTLFLLLSKF
jgi:carbohydrate-binding DOMON domain-containing protein